MWFFKFLDEAYLNGGPCAGIFNCTNSKGENSFKCDEDRPTTCASDKFQCKQSKQCIPNIWVCDNHVDCPDDSSDEEDCPECIEFKCANGVCIGSDNLCNGVNNCGDNSDELNCTMECGENEHFCHPKGCISNDKLCNGEIDCYDGDFFFFTFFYKIFKSQKKKKINLFYQFYPQQAMKCV